MRTRSNYKNLSKADQANFVAVVKQLKWVGVYDDFVTQHRAASLASPSPAHMGPGFLPWHREFLLRFENALLGLGFSQQLGLPYWDWTVDNAKTYTALTAISWTNRSVTATTETAHGVQVEGQLQISGVTPSGYNGTFTALAGTTGNTLVYALDTNPGTATVLGGAGSPLWADTFMGGNGDSKQSDKVTKGPFAYNALTAISWSNGLVMARTTAAHGVQVQQAFQISGVTPSGYNGTFEARTGTTGNTLVYALAANPGTATVLGGTGWILNIVDQTENDHFLKRAFGVISETLPDSTSVGKAKNFTPYDTQPWIGTAGWPPSDTLGFRRGMESIHNEAHGWVGGSMFSSCSPNDPVFWLHHCNIDRLWAEWENSNPGWPYLPPTGTINTTFSCSANSSTIAVASAAGILEGVGASGPGIPANTVVTNVSGTTITLSQETTAAVTNAAVAFALVPLGHGLDDSMMPKLDGSLISPTPHCVLNHRALGYKYDTEKDQRTYAAISWAAGNSDGTLGSYWRAYGAYDSGDGGTVYEKAYDNGKLGAWVKINENLSGARYVAAVALPDSGDPVKRPIRVYVAQEQGGGHAIQEYSWNGAPPWINTKTWTLPTPVTSIAAVLWQDGSGPHVRVYAGYLGDQKVPTIRVLRWDRDQGWTDDNLAFDKTLISAFSWQEGDGVRIRVHAKDRYEQIRVLFSRDGNLYFEEGLP